MCFFREKKKWKRSVGGAGILAMCVMLTICKIPTQAAEFRHKHGSICYTQGTVACSAEHKQTTRPESTMAHCDNCGTQTAQTTYVRWEICEGDGATYELGGYRNCGICGARTYEWNHSAWQHERSGEVLTCQKGNSVTGTLWLSKNTSEWTAGKVLLEAGVKIISNELSLANRPFSWDKKATWTSEKRREVSENGTYTVFAKSADGTLVSESIRVTNIDHTAPKLTGVDRSITSWTNGDVTVTLYAEDDQPEGKAGCGMSETPYSYDGGVTFVSDNTLTVSGNGSLEIWLADRLGNIGRETVEVTNIDKKPPEIISVEVLSDGWQREFVTVGVTAVDAAGESGLHNEAYSIDGGITWTNASQFDFSENGTYRLQVRDLVGNVAEQEFEITEIDVTAPVIEELRVAPDKVYKDKVFVTICSKDIQPDGNAGCGLHNTAYSVDGGKTWQEENTFWVKEGCTYDVRVRDMLEWDSGERKMTRKNFPYPQEDAEELPDDEQELPDVEPKEEPDLEDEPVVREDAEENEPEKNEEEIQPEPEKEKFQVNPDGIYAYGRWYMYRKENGNNVAKNEEEKGVTVKEETVTVLQETMKRGSEKQAHVITPSWYITPVGKMMIVGLTVLAAGAVISVLVLLLLYSVPVYCMDREKRYYLGRVLLHRTKEGYTVFLSELLLQTAPVPKYRMKVSKLLLKKIENMRLLVQSEEKNLEVLLQETIDFEL